jgi:bifunctional DNase/RNase
MVYLVILYEYGEFQFPPGGQEFMDGYSFVGKIRIMVVVPKQKIARLVATTGLWLTVVLMPSGDTLAEGLISAAPEKNSLVQVKVHQLILDPERKQPVVILADRREERGLFIWIGFPEAGAISSEMEGIDHRRPLTHDLLESIIKQSNSRIHQVVITHIKEGTFYATIQMESRGSLMEVDARPSDSLVLALKFKAPIFVSKSLFSKSSIPLGEKKEIEEEYGVTFQELTPSLAEKFFYGSTRGILVSDVREGSRAQKDGIERGDIFVEVAGQAISDVISMREALKRSKTAVQAKIFRKVHLISITIHPQ